MNLNIIGLLEMALQTNSHELYLKNGRSPQIRHSARNWSAWEEVNFPTNNLRSVLLEILDSRQRERLLADSFLTGELQIGKSRVSFEMGLPDDGFEAHFRWQPKSLQSFEQWGFPAFLAESLGQRSSLHLLLGQDPSVVEAASRALIGEVLSKRNLHCVGFVRSLGDEIQALGTFSRYPEGAMKVWMEQGGSADIVVLQIKDKADWESALELSNSGHSVLGLLRSGEVLPTLRGTIQKWEAGSNLAWRLSKALLTATAVGALPHLDQKSWTPIFEFFVATDLAKSFLRETKWDSLKELMANSGDKTSMRSWNQSILQSLTKRKIDVAMAFQASHSPEELDHLMKKLGI